MPSKYISVVHYSGGAKVTIDNIAPTLSWFGFDIMIDGIMFIAFPMYFSHSTEFSMSLCFRIACPKITLIAANQLRDGDIPVE